MSAITEQPTNGFIVTPDNSNEIGSGNRAPGFNAMPVRGVGAILWIGVAGNLVATTEGGDDIVFQNVPSGTLLPVKIVKVWNIHPNLGSTTCSEIRALF